MSEHALETTSKPRSFWREPNSYWLWLYPCLCLAAFTILFSVVTPSSAELDSVRRMSQVQTFDDRPDRLAQTLGLAADLQYESAVKPLRVLLNSAATKALGQHVPWLLLMHPTRSAQDRLFQLDPDATGQWHAPYIEPELLHETRWRVILFASVDACKTGNAKCLDASIWQLHARWTRPQGRAIVALRPRYRNP